MLFRSLLIHTVQGTLNVTSQGSFTVTLAPSSLSIKRGTSANYTVTVTGLNGFASDVSLTVSGVPSRVTATLSPAKVTGGTGTATLSLAAAKNAALTSNATITVTGTGGGLSAGGTAKVSITN